MFLLIVIPQNAVIHSYKVQLLLTRRIISLSAIPINGTKSDAININSENINYVATIMTRMSAPMTHGPTELCSTMLFCKKMSCLSAPVTHDMLAWYDRHDRPTCHIGMLCHGLKAHLNWTYVLNLLTAVEFALIMPQLWHRTSCLQKDPHQQFPNFYFVTNLA